jgi:phage host-nuclease inhibitor protein Gam
MNDKDKQENQELSLVDRVDNLEKEVKILQGRLNNRDPKISARLKGENLGLNKRISLLHKALWGLISETQLPKQDEDARTQFDVLRKTVVDYCKKNNIDQEIWKNLEY